MRRITCWLMLASLMLIQAHSFVPHHHHDEDAPAHGHTADHQVGFGEQVDHNSALECPHPDVSPHVEPLLGNVTPPQNLQFGLSMALPGSIELSLPELVCEGKRELIRLEIPYATGPPGTKTSRAPPASLTA